MPRDRLAVLSQDYFRLGPEYADFVTWNIGDPCRFYGLVNCLALYGDDQRPVSPELSHRKGIHPSLKTDRLWKGVQHGGIGINDSTEPVVYA